ncbi:MAG: ABC transporter permease, partial [Bacteroidia bacterium]|nr:ABC transporter permease [Bacteroidia bacterium]
MAIVLAVFSIVLGTAIIQIAISVTTGFEKQIQSKITGFVSDVQITNYFSEALDTLQPLGLPPHFCKSIMQLNSNVQSCYPYLQRSAILKSSSFLEGIELKGINSEWDSTFIYRSLKKGRLIRWVAGKVSNEILVSSKIADKLVLDVGDKVRLYFWEREKVRVRVVNICGIYETGLLEFDQRMVFCDIQMLQKLLGWQPHQYQGIEIQLKKPNSSQERINFAAQINAQLGTSCKAYAADELYQDIFQWLSLQHQHVFFILVFMIIVAIINMASAMIILIIEKISFIGLLKALGASNFFIQKLFLFQAFIIISLSVLGGNLVATLLLSIQQKFQFITMDPDAYFVKTVPVDWPLFEFLKANL